MVNIYYDARRESNAMKKLCLRFSFLLLVSLFWPVWTAPATPDKATAIEWVEEHAADLGELNHDIWSFAEIGLEETRSAAALQDVLRANGFTIESGVANMPTAFVASYGSGRPIIGILAEYDALPGLSQQAATERVARDEVKAGHGCGHSVFATASTGAAIAAKQFLAEGGSGTIRLYGTPAEETGIGKTFMLRDGLFDDVDVIFSWHANDKTQVSFAYTKALTSMKFRFHGLPAHSSTSPHQGRSALDAVELMNIGANYLREHVKPDTRIHYVITHGGDQPNVVPPEAEVWYYLRANKHYDVEDYFERLKKIAEGAALMTGTSWELQVDSDNHEVLPNRPLSELIYKNLEHIGPPKFTDEEKAFARAVQESGGMEHEVALSETLEPLTDEPGQGLASTDVGDVSWRVPVGRLTVATYAYGSPGHSWQIVACTGTSIGEKGLLVAAKAMAASAVDVFLDPSIAEAAREDFDRRRQAYPFVSLLPPDREAPKTIR